MAQALKNNTALLSQTRNSQITFFYTIKIGDYHLRYSLPCYSESKRHNASCFNYKLQDIVKNAKNNYQDYEEMAKSGAVIEINIDWKCYKPLLRNFDSSRDCEQEHYFTRKGNDILDWPYEVTRLDIIISNHEKRNFRWYKLLRLVAKPNARLYYFNFYKFITSLFAYTSAFKGIMWIFNKYVRHLLKNYPGDVDEVIDLNGQGQLDEEQVTSTQIADCSEEDQDENETDEKSPLLLSVKNAKSD